ncbi:nicotinate (nicotinamide) nucleotide adenylyltransferase [Ramlibacter terrae]|uniref:Probable nicotinate-nucleotide adenylyltransferase n=1 Tax=Ramlibacter terrae TaxID=2732511 RepID=A0ABX6P5N5_9BURK|nr:nicotinate (nicotinamide) nucleotide adenylyltransferase [Ramlibacter terrae]
MFGGAFDPPHNAHVALADAAVRQLGLSLLYVVPTGDAWHKARTLTEGAHREAMARLAFGSVPSVRVDGRELARSGPTYTVDTLRELRAAHPGDELCLLMGEDQAAGFERWHRWQEIAGLAVLAVAQRDNSGGDGIALLGALPGVRVERLRMPRRPESATAIRARLTAGQDITQLVPAPVASYIAQHNLYQSA